MRAGLGCVAARVVVLAAVVSALTCGPARAAPVTRELIGRSVRGRPIYVFRDGRPGRFAVLIVGCTDGDEPAGIRIAEAMRRLPPPAGVDLWLLPTVNPDGVAAATTGNAHGVDLNRNFPYGWKYLGGSGHFDSGRRPLSEPESRALFRLLLRLKPRLAIWFHQPLAVVDDSQGSRLLERTFAHLVGLPPRPLADYPGSITNWESHRFPHSTAFVTELPPGRLTPSQTSRFVHAILTLARQARR